MKRLLAVLLVAALPVTSLAESGGDWMGFTDVWSEASNWEEGLTDLGDGIVGNSYDKWSVDPDDVTLLYGGTEMPLIQASDGWNGWGWARIRNGALLTQTGGSQEWYSNTAGQRASYNLYGGAQHDMTGGSQIAWHRVSIGALDQNTTLGAGTLNIWGTSLFEILVGADELNLDDEVVPGLTMGPDGLIDIRDAGAFRMLADATSLLQGYEAAGRLVAGEADYHLAYNNISNVNGTFVEVTAVQFADFDEDGDVDGADFLLWQRDLGDPASLAEWENHFGEVNGSVAALSAVPEPGSMLLLLTGAGLVALRRRRRD